MRTPESIDRQLGRFGKNPSGGALFKLTWSEDILWWERGEMRPRYPGRNCFVLLRWRGPEWYGSRSSWENTRDWEAGSATFGESLLGPFPTQGDYEPMYFFTELRDAGCGSLIPQEVVTLICELVLKSGEFTIGERKAAMAEARRRSEADFQRLIDDYCAEKLALPSMRNAEINTGQTSKRKIGPDFVRFKSTTADLPECVRNLGRGFSQIGNTEAIGNRQEATGEERAARG